MKSFDDIRKLIHSNRHMVKLTMPAKQKFDKLSEDQKLQIVEEMNKFINTEFEELRTFYNQTTRETWERYKYIFAEAPEYRTLLQLRKKVRQAWNEKIRKGLTHDMRS